MVKKKIVPAIHQLFYSSGVSRYLAKRKPRARVIMFHGVGGPSCPTEVFVSQMEYLAKNFSVISLKSAVEKSAKPGESFKSEIVLTFDDGLRNNFTIAYPVLLRLGLCATFFVCPGLIETGKWLWNHEVRQRLLSCTDHDLMDFCGQIEIFFEKQIDENLLVERILDWMKTLDIKKRKVIESLICSFSPNFKPTLNQNSRYEPLRWDELNSVQPELISVGSHTINHPMLNSVSSEESRFEIQESRRLLEKRLNRPVEFFCYPNGEYNDTTIDIVRNSYTAAVTTSNGFFGNGDDIYRIKRIPAAYNLPLFSWRLFRPV